MQRLLSGLALVVGIWAAIWFLTTFQLLLVAEAVLALALLEYARLAEALGVPVMRAVGGVAAALAAASLALAWPLEVAPLAALIAVGAVVIGTRNPRRGVLGEASATLFPTLYLGLPLGALVATHGVAGREGVLLLLVTTVVSDTAQFYCGRLFGRHKLSPIISPKKTVEGAIGGFVVAPLVMAVVARWWLPQAPTSTVILAGLVLVGLGIVGDLFESLLKRSAGVKDSSTLIPGHGGILDRIDSLLFAAPAYYLFVKYGL